MIFRQEIYDKNNAQSANWNSRSSGETVFGVTHFTGFTIPQFVDMLGVF